MPTVTTNAFFRFFISHSTKDPTQLRRLNGAVFPIQYNESFYQDILKRPNPELNKFAYWHGIVVGAVCTRFEDTGDGRQRLYIMTLAVFAAYRGRGIGSQLLQSILNYCDEHRIASEISLHVQVSNQGAIDFYTQRFAFTLGERVDYYYRRIDPPHCYRLYKVLEMRPASHVDGEQSNNDERATDASATNSGGPAEIDVKPKS